MQVSTEHLLTFDHHIPSGLASFPAPHPAAHHLHKVWQSQVEIEHYSFAYFDRVTTICSAELLLRTRLMRAT